MYFPQVAGRVEISVKSEIIENNSLLDSVNTLEGRDGIQKDSDRLEVGLCKHPSSTRPNARSCTWVRVIPSTNANWVENGSRLSPWGERFGGVCGPKAQQKLAVCICSPESQSHPGLHHRKQGQQGKGGDSASVLS